MNTESDTPTSSEQLLRKAGGWYESGGMLPSSGAASVTALHVPPHSLLFGHMLMAGSCAVLHAAHCALPVPTEKLPAGQGRHALSPSVEK